jgi:hypothetical protein
VSFTLLLASIFSASTLMRKLSSVLSWDSDPLLGRRPYSLSL